MIDRRGDRPLLVPPWRTHLRPRGVVFVLRAPLDQRPIRGPEAIDAKLNRVVVKFLLADRLRGNVRDQGAPRLRVGTY
jgi:hypothetical protein